VIVALLMMKMPPHQEPKSKTPAWTHLSEGARYAFGLPPIRWLLVVLALVSFAGTPYGVLMPVFAATIFHGGPGTLGILMGASGVGALVGALYLANRRSVLGLSRVVPVATGVLGLGLCIFSHTRVLGAGLFILLFTGFGMMTLMGGSNIIIQTIVDDDKRGRVMSFYTLSLLGMAPLGSLAGGWLATRIGAPDTVLIGGALCAAAGGLFVIKLPQVRHSIRPIYKKLGILPGDPVPPPPPPPPVD
jgi:MFS family permease